MDLERDALSIRNIPIDVTIPNATGQLYTYNSSTRIFTLVTPLAGTKQYFVADSSGGAVTRRLTFTNGILTSES